MEVTGGEVQMDSDYPWIIFSYKSPSETSTLRVRAWRILRRIGALSLQQSVCAVPNTPETTRKLHQLAELIQEGGGETLWLDVTQFSAETTKELSRRFNLERSAECSEFIEACSALTRASEPEESEVELKRLQKWLRKLKARDYFQCGDMEAAERCLERLEREFELVRVEDTGP